MESYVLVNEKSKKGYVKDVRMGKRKSVAIILSNNVVNIVKEKIFKFL